MGRQNTLCVRALRPPIDLSSLAQIGLILLFWLLGALLVRVVLFVPAVPTPLARPRALQAGQSEGAVAGLAMVLAGLLNLMLAPLLFPLFD